MLNPLTNKFLTMKHIPMKTSDKIAETNLTHSVDFYRMHNLQNQLNNPVNLLYKTKKNLLLLVALAAFMLLSSAKTYAGDVYSTPPGMGASVTTYSDWGGYGYSPGKNYYYFNGSPQYGIYFNYNNNGNNRWEIWQISPTNRMEYYSTSNGTLPPQTGWVSYYGAAPVPVLSGTSTLQLSLFF